jgi:tetratricopeptide (TPR) repeat protein
MAAKALQSAQQAHALEVTLKTKRALSEASRVAKEPNEVVKGLVNDALTLGAQDAELNYTYAMLAYDRGELELALGRLRRTIELSNQKTGRPFFRAQMRLARVYLLSGKKAEARTVLEAITERNPTHVRATMLLERLKGEDAAVVVTPTTVDAGAPPKAADAGAGMDPDPARPGSQGTAELDGDYDVLVSRAEKLSFAGQTAQAMALYRRALVKRPMGVEALTGLGYALLDQKRIGEAIAHFRQALGVSSNYGEALIGLAEASQQSGNPKQALHYYRTYLRSHPSGRRAVLAQTNIKELEEKIGTPEERPTTEPGGDPDRPPPMVTEPPPPMDPDRPPPMVTEPPPPMVTEPPPPMDPDRPPPMVTEPPPPMDPDRPPPMVTEPPSRESSEGM